MKWTAIGKFALKVGEAILPGVKQVEDAVDVFKHPATGAQKLDAAEQIILNSIGIAEFGADKDLLDEPTVKAAFRQFISAGNDFAKALQLAKAAKVH